MNSWETNVNNMKKTRTSLLLTAFILAISVLVAGCFASSEEKMRRKAIPFYREALDYFYDGQFPIAKDKVLLAMKQYPQFVEAHILYQRILAHDKMTKELLKEYHKLMKDHPGNPIYIYLYARLLDDLDEQERLYKRILDIDKDCPWGYFGLGWVSYKRMDYATAAENFQKAVQLDPNNPLFHLNLGAVYYLMGHSHDATDEILKATELDPKFANAWYSLAATYYQRAEFDKAAEALRKYINIYPAAPDRRKVEKTIMQLSGGKL